MLNRRTYAQLYEAKATHADWRAAHPTVHWPPVSLPVALLVAVDCIEHGRPDEGFALLLCFAALLRIGEVTALQVRDVVLPGDARLWGSRFPVLALRHTKTGDDMSAEVRLPWLFALLREWRDRRLSAVGGRGRLAPGRTHLRGALQASLQRLGLLSAGFVVHSFRAGGALYLLTGGESLAEVLRRGRWRQPEGARPYLQRLRALAAYADLPPAVLARAARLAEVPGLALRLYLGW